MKLSEAMRKGSTITRPTSGAYVRNGRTGFIEFSCALGSVYVGVEGVDATEQPSISTWLETNFPVLDAGFEHPAKWSTRTLANIIIDLNDNLGWTREKIADWLESIDL